MWGVYTRARRGGQSVTGFREINRATFGASLHVTFYVCYLWSSVVGWITVSGLYRYIYMGFTCCIYMAVLFDMSELSELTSMSKAMEN